MLSPFRMVCRDLHSTRVCKLCLFMLFSICASYCTLSLFKNFASTLRHIFTSLKRLFGRKYDSGTRPMWRRPFACALLACFARIHADHPAAASVMMNGAPPPNFLIGGGAQSVIHRKARPLFAWRRWPLYPSTENR